MTIPHQRQPIHDRLDHPEWCSPALCEPVGARDVVHVEVPSVFVTRQGAPVSIARVRDDELDELGRQTVHPHEVQLRDEDGHAVLTLALADLPGFCAWVLSHGRMAV